MLCRPILLLGVAVAMVVISGCGQSEPKSLATYRKVFQAEEEGDYETAVELLTQLIEEEPAAFGYYRRGLIYVQHLDQPEKAIEDANEALKLDRDWKDAEWLLQEASKPAGKRFLGRNAKPPSDYK